MRSVERRFSGVISVVLIGLATLTGAYFYDRLIAAPAGLFEQRLEYLQHSGSCTDLPTFGVSTHRRRNPDETNIRLATEVGAHIVRFDIYWEYLEEEGQFKFRKYDPLIRGLREKVITVLLILTYGHPDHSDKSPHSGFLPPRTSEQRDAFYRYIRAVVNRYRGADIAYQILNEPNMDDDWPAETYGQLLAAAAKEIRAVDPGAKIIAAGLANIRNRDAYIYGLKASADLGLLDALAFHPYRTDAPEKSLTDVAKFESIGFAKNLSKDLWLTEWGYSETWFRKKYPSSDLRKRQAIMIARLMLVAAIAKVRVLIVYDLIDDGVDIANAEHKFGLYDYEFRSKAAVQSFHALAAVMSDCDQYNIEFDAPKKIAIVTFKKNSGITRVIWTYDFARNRKVCVELSSSSTASVVDIFGNPIVFDPCDGGVNINISEPIGPVILRSNN